MTKQTCKGCRFYEAKTALYFEGSGKKNVERFTGEGLCRANPPLISPDMYGDQGTWPTVSDSDWCGKFEKKNG